MDLIDRHEAIKAMSCLTDGICEGEAIEALCDLPSAQPDLSEYSDKLWKAAYERGRAEAQPERRPGRWIPVMNGRGGHCCNRCNGYAPSYMNGDEHLSDFCPFCGADMRGEQDD